jgi:hypothetical protein
MSQDKHASQVKELALESLEIKDEAKGEIEAIVATLGVVDRDKEVILTDAIKSGSKVKMSSYAHDIVPGIFGGGGKIPVGKGTVHVEKDKLIFRGKCFMGTERGRETFEVLKEMGKDQEWSIGFQIIGTELPDETWQKRGAELMLTKIEVFEVSPVLIGAGLGTQTVAAKSIKDTVKEAVKEVDEEAERTKAEAEAAQRKADEELATKKAADEAAAAEATRLEAERVELERKAAEEAETKRLADEKEELEKKEAAIRLASTLEFERFQRTLHRPFVRG